MRHHVLVSLLITSVVLLTACRGAERRAVPSVRTSSGVTWSQVDVIPFSIAGAQVAGYDGTTDQIGTKVAESIVKALRGQGAKGVVVAFATPGQGRVVLEGRVVVFDGGSRADRYLSGMWTGAGAAIVEIEGRAIGEGGKVLGEFRSRDTGQFGSFGGNSNDLLSTCVEVVGERRR